MPASACVLLTTITPAATGNGLAMRSGMLLRALATDRPVHVVVVPLAEPHPMPPTPFLDVAASVCRLQVPLRATPSAAARLVGDAAWRERVGRLGQLPSAVAHAPPSGVDSVLAGLPGDLRAPIVVAHREALWLLGAATAHEFPDSRLVVDLDDDEADFASAHGDIAAAAASRRLGDAMSSATDAVLLAAPEDARRVSGRVTCPVVHIPHAVALPDLGSPSRPPPGGPARLLFVANLTYAPNVAAAVELVRSIAPALRERLGAERAVVVDLVGNPSRAVRALASGTTRVWGHVPDVAAHYRDATVAVIPLRSGSGSSIKALEAFADGVPVVATPTGVRGLTITSGTEVLVADRPAALADHCRQLVNDRVSARALSAAARDHVAREHTFAMLADRIRAVVGGIGPAGTARDRED